MGNDISKTSKSMAKRIHLSPIDRESLRKFMKIVIRGSKKSGKSSLFQRLQYRDFSDEYSPSMQIQVANILWTYPSSDDVIKLELWDVVDEGIRNGAMQNDGIDWDESFISNPYKGSLKKGTHAQVLDSSQLDVYSQTHGVILIFSLCDTESLHYVEREIFLVPSHLPVLVLGNFSDLADHTVTQQAINELFESLSGRAGLVRYAECSMKTGEGLEFISFFFNLPFLQLQRQTLLKKLEINSNELQIALKKLHLIEKTPVNNEEMPDTAEGYLEAPPAAKENFDFLDKPEGHKAPLEIMEEKYQKLKDASTLDWNFSTYSDDQVWK